MAVVPVVTVPVMRASAEVAVTFTGSAEIVVGAKPVRRETLHP
jgi:hypothetical protein